MLMSSSSSSRRIMSTMSSMTSMRSSSSSSRSSSSRRNGLRISIDGNISSGKSTVVATLANFFPTTSSLTSLTTPNNNMTTTTNSSHTHNNKKEPIQVEIVPEPLEKWTNLDGHNLLDMFYKDPVKNNFLFQHFVQLTRLMDVVRDDDDEDLSRSQVNTYKFKDDPEGDDVDDDFDAQVPRKIKLFERSLQNNRYCFIELAKRQGTLEDVEFNVIVEWYNWLEENLDLSLDLVIYLKTSPRVVYERMQKRGRLEECGVPLAYLEDLHETYEGWLGRRKSAAAAGHQKVIVVDANQTQAQVAQECQKLVQEFLDQNYQRPKTNSYTNNGHHFQISTP